MPRDAHRQFYDELAHEWDLMYTATDLEFLTHMVGKLDVQEGMDILDLGCGTGILFDLLRRQVGFQGTVTGVDSSIQMALKAHRNFPFPNVNVVDADVSHLPFVEDRFDMAVSFCAFDHFGDKAKAISEIHRVLKPGAFFHVLHLHSSKEVLEIHQEIGGVITDDFLPSQEEMAEMLQAGRFTDITISDKPGLYLASARVLE